MEFMKFRSIPRLSREIIITEKIDGTNASIHLSAEGEFKVAARNGFIAPDKDNHGFAAWAYENEEALRTLGVGSHYGEWWGPGISRRYGTRTKQFSLFNTIRWKKPGITLPACVNLVPILYQGIFSEEMIDSTLQTLFDLGSVASPGFMNPEGIVIYHIAGNYLFKKTFEDDEAGKSFGNLIQCQNLPS